MKKRFLLLFLVTLLVVSAVIPALAETSIRDAIRLADMTIYYDQITKDDGTTVFKPVGSSMEFSTYGAMEAYYTGDGHDEILHQIEESRAAFGEFGFHVSTATGASSGAFYINGISQNTGSYDNIQKKVLEVARFCMALMALASFGFLVFGITRLATSNGVPAKKQKAQTTLAYSGVCLALFGSLTAVVGFLYDFL